MSYTPGVFCGGLIRLKKDGSVFRCGDKVFQGRWDEQRSMFTVSAFGDVQIGIAAEAARKDDTTVLLSLGDLPDPPVNKWSDGLPPEIDFAIKAFVAHVSGAYRDGLCGQVTLEIHVDKGRLTFWESDLSMRQGAPREIRS